MFAHYLAAVDDFLPVFHLSVGGGYAVEQLFQLQLTALLVVIQVGADILVEVVFDEQAATLRQVLVEEYLVVCVHCREQLAQVHARDILAVDHPHLRRAVNGQT